MRIRRGVLVFLLAACRGDPPRPAPADGAPERSVLAAASGITAEEMREHISFLASDQLRGRDTPSPGLEAAAAYLAREFAASGLVPAGDSGSYLQRYPYVRRFLGAEGAVVETVDYPPNVAAVLPGSDPALRNEYVVFTAHMDHVGVGAPDAAGDSIYNGADDDASGTAALLELAEAFAGLPTPPRRSVLFVAVSGEEKGLLGSAHFVEQATVPPSGIAANLNMDMIGRNAADTIVVIGQEFSSLGVDVHAAAERAGARLVVARDPWPEERLFFRSDHYSFAKKEIPALFFFAGLHADYHRPSDHVEKIDADKAARVARLVFHTGYLVAARVERPRWTEDGLARMRELSR